MGLWLPSYLILPRWWLGIHFHLPPSKGRQFDDHLWIFMFVSSILTTFSNTFLRILRNLMPYKQTGLNKNQCENPAKEIRDFMPRILLEEIHFYTKWGYPKENLPSHVASFSSLEAHHLLWYNLPRDEAVVLGSCIPSLGDVYECRSLKEHDRCAQDSGAETQILHQHCASWTPCGALQETIGTDQVHHCILLVLWPPNCHLSASFLHL